MIVGSQPATPHPTSRVKIRIGDAFAPDELGDRDHWLTARWAMWFTPLGLRLWSRAEHAIWPFFRADVLELDDRLVTASGLPAPTGDPLVHWSPSLEVRIGRPRAPFETW